MNAEKQRILLILDGHGTHTHAPNLDLCRENNIDVCFLPPHTSHILQPLDVGIFNSCKAAYRRGGSDPALNAINTNYLSEATKTRFRMLGRSMTAQLHAVNKRSIRRSFHYTGIYPFSFHHFIFYCHGVRDVPVQVREEAAQAVQAEKEAEGQRLLGKRRRSVQDEMYLINSNA